MAKPKRTELYGVGIARAPGSEGGYVVFVGPIDLARAELLSPHWRRDRMETRPTKVQLDPDPQNGRPRSVVAPVLTKVGEVDVYGEAVDRALKKANLELGKLSTAALMGAPLDLETLAGMRRETKPKRKPTLLTDESARIHAERALGFFGRPDIEVKRALKKLGRSDAQIEAYLVSRHVEHAA